MSESKHTTGPWGISPHPWPDQIGCCPLTGRPYSVHGTDHRNVAAASTKANARLIAAAPEMYELVELVHGSFGGGRVITFSDDDIAKFAEVLAKAEGRS